MAVVGQREITALQLVATQRPYSTDAQGRTVRHPVHNSEMSIERDLKSGVGSSVLMNVCARI